MSPKQSVLLFAVYMLLQGCVSNPVNSISDLVPGGFDDSKPYLAQLDGNHAQALNSIGAEEDRYRVQSEGLGLIDHAKLEAYINRHLNRLKLGSGIEQLEGRAYLSAELGFSARTSADGNIYIPIEMLRDLETNDELAALLAHELAHAILNHTNSDLLVSLQKKVLYVSALTSGGSSEQASDLIDKRRVRNTLGMLLISDGFLNPGWSRGQELDADKLGLDLLVKANYNPEGMAVLLRKLEAWEVRNADLMAEREARRKVLLDAAQAEAGADIDQQLKLIMQEASHGLKGLLSSFSESHPDIEKRIKALQSYTLLHYRRAARPPMNKSVWQQLITSSQTKALIQSVASANEAQGMLADNQVAEASKKALSAIDKYSTHQNYIRILMANIRDAQGQRSKVKANVQYGLKGRYPAYKLHYYDAILGGNDRAKLAVRMNQLIQLFDSYGKPPRHYVDLITLAEATGNDLLKSKLQIECRVSYVGEAISCAPNERAASQEISYDRMVDMLL